MEFVPADRCVKTGKILTYQMLEREQKRYDQFEGLTFFEQIDKLEAQILAESSPPVYESFETDLSYGYGIGLSIVLNVETINRKAIEQAIMKFRELGEKDWQVVDCVPIETLITKGE